MTINNKPIIAVDIDDVLAANAKGFIEFSNKKWGTTLTVDDYDEHWMQIWNVDLEETKARAEVFHTSRIIREYEHFAEAQEILEYLARTYQLHIVTARRLMMQADTKQWINTYFPNVFSGIHHAGIWDKTIDHTTIHNTKADVCQEIGASYLIDDQLKHCRGAAELGIQSLLYGDYRWNQADSLPPRITRVKDWQAIKEYFSGR